MILYWPYHIGIVSCHFSPILRPHPHSHLDVGGNSSSRGAGGGSRSGSSARGAIPKYCRPPSVPLQPFRRLHRKGRPTHPWGGKCALKLLPYHIPSQYPELLFNVIFDMEHSSVAMATFKSQHGKSCVKIHQVTGASFQGAPDGTWIWRNFSNRNLTWQRASRLVLATTAWVFIGRWRRRSGY